jgi:hypothetical protein
MDEPQRIPNDDKEWLVRRIAAVKDKTCYLEILEMIHTGDLAYTVNNNGIYFNLATVPDATINKMSAILTKYEKRTKQREPTR